MCFRAAPHNHPVRLVEGLSDLIPKLIAYRILEPVLAIQVGVQIECCEDTPEKLLLRLAAHELDLVVTDVPAYSAVRARAFNRPLGSRVALFASPRLAHFYRKRLPDSLTGAPFLLPMKNFLLRQVMGE
jgi:LysR family transcriptional activator of nhaA